MTKTCEICSTPFEAKRPHAKFCSPRCRVRSSRGAGAPESSLPSLEIDEDSSLAATATAELKAVGRQSTHLGKAAIRLAEQIDRSTAVMGYAALVKEFRVTMGAALATAESGDQLDGMRDELAERRARHGTG